MARFGKFVEDVSGTEIVEAALVLPLVFLLMLAIFWFGRAFNISSTLARAVKEGVLVATHNTCSTCGNAAASNQAIADTVQNILSVDHLDPASLQAYAPPYICTPATAPVCTTTVTPSAGPAFNLQICTNVPLTCGTGVVAGCGSSTPPTCGTSPILGTRVSAAYLFNFRLGLSNLPAPKIPASAQSQVEY